MELSKVIPFFYILLLFSCREKNEVESIEKSLLDLGDKFKLYPKLSGKLSEYKLVRSVTLGESGLELQLRSGPEEIGDLNNVIVIINKSKKAYSVPLFNNAYRGYWNFVFDNTPSKVKAGNNTTFQKELQTCIDSLQLNNNPNLAYKVIDEMLLSLLHCRIINDDDSAGMHVLQLRENIQLKQESFDTCRTRCRNNWNAISKELHPESNIISKRFFWDEKNGRIYQLDYSSARDSLIRIDLKVYRQDCIFTYMSL